MILDGAYLLRSGEKIPIKAQQILYGTNDQASMRLQSGDTFLIPFNQRLVTVSGAVVRSGVFAYVPDKGINYYIALAGGLSDDATYPTSISVYGPDGRKVDLDCRSSPESTITVAQKFICTGYCPDCCRNRLGQFHSWHRCHSRQHLLRCQDPVGGA